MAEEIVEKKQTFSDYMLATLTEKEEALPTGFNKQRFVTNLISFINDTPELQKYGKQQIMLGAMKAAVLGLEPSLKQCYLIPYGDQLQFQIDYKGSKLLAKKYATRPIIDISAEVVREGDVFKKTVSNNNTEFSFEPLPFNDNKVVGAFAYVKYADGGCQVEEMSLSALEKVRSKSKASNSMAWKDFTTEMYKKTVLHRLCKHIDINFENIEQRNLFNEDMAIDTTPKKVETDNPFTDADIVSEQ